jgi:D-alanyl-D-alanine carboxypeptidase
MAVLAVALRREFPEYAHYFAYEGFSYGGKAYTNYNLLIGRFPDADGMKTGFICASGFNQVSSATRNGKTVVSVVFGAASQEERAESARLAPQGSLTTTAWVRTSDACQYEALWRGAGIALPISRAAFARRKPALRATKAVMSKARWFSIPPI